MTGTVVAVAFPAPGGGTRTLTLAVGHNEASLAAAQRFGAKQGLTSEAIARLAKHIDSRRRAVLRSLTRVLIVPLFPAVTGSEGNFT